MLMNDLPIDEVLNFYYGWKGKKMGRNEKYIGKCPFPNHNDKHDSFAIDLERNKCKCFAFCEPTTPADIIMNFYDCSFQDAIKHAEKDFGISTRKAKKADRKAKANVNANISEKEKRQALANLASLRAISYDYATQQHYYMNEMDLLNDSIYDKKQILEEIKCESCICEAVALPTGISLYKQNAITLAKKITARKASYELTDICNIFSYDFGHCYKVCCYDKNDDALSEVTLFYENGYFSFAEILYMQKN